MVDTGCVLLGLKLVTKVSPNLLTWLDDKTLGKKILIVGQARSGKTSFLNYMQHAIFADDEHGEPRTTQKNSSGSMRLKLGPRKSLELKVKEIIDTVGQAPEINHAQDVKKSKADAILVFVSADKPLSGQPDACEEYLTDLFEHLAEMAGHTPAFAKRAKVVIIVQNKVDLVDEVDGVERRKQLHAHVRPLVASCRFSRRCSAG